MRDEAAAARDLGAAVHGARAHEAGGADEGPPTIWDRTRADRAADAADRAAAAADAETAAADHETAAADHEAAATDHEAATEDRSDPPER
jgi:hypothetical protein